MNPVANHPLPAGINHLERIRLIRLLATVPLLCAAIFNTGYQFLLALSVSGDVTPDSWRSELLLSWLGQDPDTNLLTVLLAGLVHVLPVLVVSLLTAGIWERIFSEVRNRYFDTGFVYIAIVFTLFMHPAVSLFHVAFAISFGMVFARGIFGGEGRSFLNPVLVAVAVLQISFPATLTDHPLWIAVSGYAGTDSFMVFHEQGEGGLIWAGSGWWQAFVGNIQGFMGTTSVLAVVLGGAVLFRARVVSWRLLAAHLAGLVVAASFCNTIGGGILDMSWYWHLVLGSFACGVVFLASDPSSSCATDTGRWVQGLIAGALVVMLRVVNPSHPDSVIQVLLLVSMLAPLIDHVVTWLNIRQRMRHSDG